MHRQPILAWDLAEWDEIARLLGRVGGVCYVAWTDEPMEVALGNGLIGELVVLIFVVAATVAGFVYVRRLNRR